MRRALLNVFLLLLWCLVTSGGGGFVDAAGGRWDLLLENLGVVAENMQLLQNDGVVISERIDLGFSKFNISGIDCAANPTGCTAHSVEYDVPSNTVRPLNITTTTCCASGAVTPDGVLVQTGDLLVRRFSPCAGKRFCDWAWAVNDPDNPIERRVFATKQVLPDGTHIIVGGRNVFSYEFYPSIKKNPELPFLKETYDYNTETAYPFLFLNADGNLFIFANNRSILFNYTSNSVVREYPIIEGGWRTYPSTGSAVLLPLKNASAPAASIAVEVLVCGGAPVDAYPKAKKGNFVPALDTCGRMTITDPKPRWEMEKMPMARLMGDMVNLPNGEVLIINGAASGSADWGFALEPVMTPVLYQPEKPAGSRFVPQEPSTIPRLYPSTAILVRDGRVLVGGSNPHKYDHSTTDKFPKELRLEAFSPSYLTDPSSASKRPTIVTPASQARFRYGDKFPVWFRVAGEVDHGQIAV